MDKPIDFLAEAEKRNRFIPKFWRSKEDILEEIRERTSKEFLYRILRSRNAKEKYSDLVSYLEVMSSVPIPQPPQRGKIVSFMERILGIPSGPLYNIFEIADLTIKDMTFDEEGIVTQLVFFQDSYELIAVPDRSERIYIHAQKELSEVKPGDSITILVSELTSKPLLSTNLYGVKPNYR